LISKNLLIDGIIKQTLDNSEHFTELIAIKTKLIKNVRKDIRSYCSSNASIYFQYNCFSIFVMVVWP